MASFNMGKNGSAIFSKDWFIVVLIFVAVIFLKQIGFIDKIDRDIYDLGVRIADRVPADNIAIIAIDDESISNMGRWPWPRKRHADLIDRLDEAGAKAIGLSLLLSEDQRDEGLVFIEQARLDIGDMIGAEPPAPPLLPVEETPAAEQNLEEIDSTTVDPDEEVWPDDEEWPEEEGEFPAEDSLADGSLDEEPSAEREPSAQEGPVTEEVKETVIASDEDLEIIVQEPMVADEPVITDERLKSVYEYLLVAEDELNNDRTLALSMANAKNVVLGMILLPGQPLGNPESETPNYVVKHAFPEDMFFDGVNAIDFALFPPTATDMLPPTQLLGQPASGIGHLTYQLDDADGKVRTESLIYDYYGEFYPSMSLILAATSLNLTRDDIAISLGEGIQLGKLKIGTGTGLQMRSFFYNERNGKPFQIDSYYDVVSGKLDITKYQGKIVLIGATASGLGDSLLTPLATPVAPVEILAHQVSSILQEDFFTVPIWSGLTSWVLTFVVLAYLAFLLPRLGAATGALVSISTFAILLFAELILLSKSGMWVALVLPAALLVIGHVSLTTKRFLITEMGKRLSDTESAQSNRMLGLAFQQQGQLDMAFDKLRRAPLDEETMELLYNLALDFERKRQFNKAVSVYQYIATVNPEYRDIPARAKRAADAQDNVIFGMKTGSSGPEDTLLNNTVNEFEKPMLGRYEVTKELGRGAMGIVYFGIDPKINREVAIKTLSLSSEFEGEELQEMKERFFAEAEAAGRLNHPNIVTIFDAGEEHDLAYIAMEFLKGHDLEEHVRPDSLLPIDKVLAIIMKSAEALSYAHEENVVHRDIKPANIMIEPESGKVKITDFGIARVSNTSRTKTGMVVGTPSFMSPEQVKGKKVDGRSDIFSLGVTLYQMLTGDLPFTSDNAAQTMYLIATEPHPNVLDARPALKKKAPWLKVILDRALAKDLDKRYQTGEQFARDLKTCIKKMKEKEEQSS